MLAHALTALVALSAPLLAFADVTPSEPGPGDVFRAGQTCPIVWLGDTNSTIDWKDMAIELMTGDNFNMIHITTVATGQDGTVDGRFEWPCPDVNPNSAIYFYQFSSPHTAVKTWVTRFTIASSTGQTTPPTNATQPGTNDPIPWGVGALVDATKATPPPNFAATNPTTPPAGGPSGSGTPGTGTSNTLSTPVASPPASNKLTTSSLATSTPAASSTNTPSKTGGAAILGVDSRILVAVAGVLSAAIAW